MAEHPDRRVSPWVPELKPIALAVLGKLIEELNEAGAIASRCIIQGINEPEPTSGQINGAALEEELGDVVACIRLCVMRLGLDEHQIEMRARRKVIYLSDWHRFIMGTSFDLAKGTDFTVYSCRATECEYRTEDRIEMYRHLEAHGEPMMPRG